MKAKKKKSKMGRPWKSSEPATERVTIRITKTERHALETEARRTGRNISEVVIARLREKE